MQYSIFAALILVLSSTGWGLQLSELRSMVRLRTRDTTVDVTRQQFSDNTLNNVLNEAQRDLVNRTWILTATTTISLASNVRTYALPNDFIAVQRVTLNNVPITEVTLQGLDQNQTNWTTVSNSTGTSSVQYYVEHALGGNVLLGLYPLISTVSANALLVYYTMQAPEMTSDASIPFNGRPEFYSYHDVLIDYATFIIWASQGDLSMAKPYLELYLSKALTMQQNIGKMPNFNPALRGDRGPNR